MPYADRDAQLAYFRVYNAGRSLSQRTTHKSKNKERNIRRRQEARLLINQAKSMPCVDCGVQFVLCVMTFDHVRGDKLFNISDWVKKHSRRSFDLLRSEIAKCDVVCANCHAVRTEDRRTRGV